MRKLSTISVTMLGTKKNSTPHMPYTRQVHVVSLLLLNLVPIQPPRNTKGMAAMLGPISSSCVSNCVVPGKILVRSPIIGEMARPGIDVHINITYRLNTAHNGRSLLP